MFGGMVEGGGAGEEKSQGFNLHLWWETRQESDYLKRVMSPSLTESRSNERTGKPALQPRSCTGLSEPIPHNLHKNFWNVRV